MNTTVGHAGRARTLLRERHGLWIDPGPESVEEAVSVSAASAGPMRSDLVFWGGTCHISATGTERFVVSHMMGGIAEVRAPRGHRTRLYSGDVIAWRIDGCLDVVGEDLEQHIISLPLSRLRALEASGELLLSRLMSPPETVALSELWRRTAEHIDHELNRTDVAPDPSVVDALTGLLAATARQVFAAPLPRGDAGRG